MKIVLAYFFACVLSGSVEAFDRTESLRAMVLYGVQNSPKVKLLFYDSKSFLYDYQKAVSSFYPSWQSGFQAQSYTSPSIYSIDVGGASNQLVTAKNHVWYSGVYQSLPTDTELYVRFETNRVATSSQNALLSPFYASSIKFGGSQRLLNGFDWFGTKLGDSWSKVVVQRKNHQGSQIELEFSLSRMIYDVESAYLNLAYLNKKVQALNEAIEATEKQLAFVLNKIKAGLFVQADSYQVEERLESRKVDLVETKKDLERSLSALVFMLGLKSDEQQKFIQTMLFDLPSFHDIPYIDPEEFMKRALQSNRNILFQKNKLEFYDMESKRYKSLSLPTLDLQGAYVLYGGNSLDNAGYRADLSELFDPRTNGWEIGVNFTVPLGPGSNVYDYKKVKNEYKRQKELLLSEEGQLKADIVESIRNANRDKEIYNSTLKLIILAEKKLNFEQKKYESGLSTNFQVLFYQEDLTDARIRNLKAMVDYYQSQSRLDFLMGRMLSEYSIKIEGDHVESGKS